MASIIKEFLKKSLIKFFAKHNYLLVTESKLKWGDNLFLTRKLQKIFSTYSVECVIDVGANIGQYARFLREEVGYSGQIISFEPDPKIFKDLSINLGNDELWFGYNLALGEEKGELQLNLMESSVFNSFLIPDHTDTKEFENCNIVKNTVNVSVHRLDEFLTEIEKKFKVNSFFLKLDTQGYDLHVIKGSSKCLKSIIGVQTEVSVLPIYNDMPSFDDSLQLFRQLDFEVSGLYSLSEERFPHAVEFDCIYLPK